jgi:hypothetical protein
MTWAPDDQYGRRWNSRSAPEEDPTSAVLVLEKRGCDLDRELPADLTHRIENRESARRIPDDLVADDRRFEFHEPLDVLARRDCEVVEGADDRAASEKLDLFGRHAGHPADQVRPLVDLVRVVDHLGPDPLVVLVREPRGAPGVAFDEDVVSPRLQPGDREWTEPNPVLVAVDLSRYADIHDCSSSSPDT